MKKIISFDKTLEFPTMIGEITSISLEDQLKFVNNSSIEGTLVVVGTYKRTEASRLEEDFHFELPTEILLTEKLDIETSKIEIEDFYYEIENDDTMICHISIMVEGVEIVEFEEKEELPILEEAERNIVEIEKTLDNEDELRDCDGDIKELEEPEKQEIEKMEEETMTKQEIKEVEISKKVESENIEIKETTEVGSLFTALKDSEETFSTYRVYIVREESTVERIMEKYHVTKEELENYNDLSQISIGSKIIIPLTNE